MSETIEAVGGPMCGKKFMDTGTTLSMDCPEQERVEVYVVVYDHLDNRVWLWDQTRSKDKTHDKYGTPAPKRKAKALLKGGPHNGMVVDCHPGARWVNVPVRAEDGISFVPVSYERTIGIEDGCQIFRYVEPED